MRSPMLITLETMKRGRTERERREVIKGLICLIAVVSICSWIVLTDNRSEKPKHMSLMGWKGKPTEQQKERILEPIRRQTEEHDRQIKEEMERSAKQ